MQSRRIGLLLLLTLAAQQAHAETWLCIGDMATGFSYNKFSQSWDISNFKVNDDRYIIKPSSGQNFKYEVKKFGSADGELPEATCKEDFAADTFLHCRGIFGEFKFNRKTLRFLRTYIGGYWTYAPGVNASKQEDDTPLMTIGKCSTL